MLILAACSIPAVLAGTASASIVYVQGNYATPQSRQTAVKVTFKNAQSAWDLNVVVVGWKDTTAVVKSVTDTRRNTYTLAVGPTRVSGSLSQSIYYAKKIAAAAAGANSVTVTFSVAAVYPDIRILEYSGASLELPVDVTAASSGTSAISATVKVGTHNPTDLIFGANIVATKTASAGSGDTKRLLTSPDGDIAEDKMVKFTGRYDANALLSSSGKWVMQMVAFRTAPAAEVVSPALSSLSCGKGSITGAGTDACSIALTAAAPSGGLKVTLASNNSAVTLPASLTVAAGSSSASFTATVAAVTSARTATLTATAGSVSKSIALQLNTVAPALSLSAASVSFGNVVLHTPATQSVTLTSSGTAPLTVGTATITGTGFSILGLSLPFTLIANQTVTLEIVFDPTTVGAATGKLTIASNSSTNSAAVISLSGAGVAASYDVQLAWDAPTNSTDRVAGYEIFRASNGSSSYQLRNLTIDTSTTYTDSSVVSGDSYTYYVESVDASGNASAPSNPYTVTIP